MYFAPVVLAALLMVFSATIVSAADHRSTVIADDLFSWHTVTERPWWVDGIQPIEHVHPWAPQFRYSDHRHQILLRPGQFSRFRVAAGEMLRIESFRGTWQQRDLQITETNGTGLTRRIKAIDVGLPDTRVIAPTWQYDRVITLKRPTDFSGGRWFVVLRSERRDAYSRLSNASPLLLDAPRTEVNTLSYGQTMYQSVEAGRRYKLPAFASVTDLDLLLRVEMPPGLPDPVLVQIYQNDKPVRTHQLLPRIEQRQVVLVEQCARGEYSQRERIHFTLPKVSDKDQDQFSISISSNALVRASSVDDDSYLFPTFNRHRSGVDEHQPFVSTQASLLHTIESVSRDGIHHDAGLIALTSADQMSRREPLWRDVAKLAKRLHGHRSYYRALWPEQSVDTAENAASTRTFAAMQLKPVDEDRHALVVSRQRLPVLLSAIARGVFHLMPGKTPRHFLLQPSVQGGFLRIAVDRATLRGNSTLTLRFDDHPLEHLSVGPISAEQHQALDAHSGLAALSFLEPSRDTTSLTDTRGGAFAVHQEPAAMVDVAWLAIPIPAGAQRLTITNDQHPLRIALDERLSRPLRAPQSVVQRRLNDRHKDIDPVLLKLLRDHEHQTLATPQDLTFAGQYRHVARFLASRARLYQAQVIAIDISSSTVGDESALAQTFEQASAAQDWPAATHAAYQLLINTGYSQRERALEDVVVALDNQGEAFLADRLLRSLWLHDSNAKVTQTAWQLLNQRYADDQFLLMGLYASALLREPNTDTLLRVVDLLLMGNEFALALDLGLAVKPGLAPIEPLLTAAVAAKRWQLFDALIAQLKSAEAVAFWRGYRAQLQGDFADALKQWSDAGSRGLHHAQRLQYGLAIRTQLWASANDDVQTRQAAKDAWMHFASASMGEENGGWRWQLSPELVLTHAGSTQQIWPELIRRRAVFRAEPDRPVTARVRGPARLKLNMRLQHAVDGSASIDDWLLIDVDGDTQRLSVGADRPVDDIVLPGEEADRFVPGRLVVHEINVGPGVHRLSIKAKDSTLLTSISRARARLPMTVLPPVSEATYTAITQPPKVAFQRRHKITWVDRCETHRAHAASGYHWPHQSIPIDAHNITYQSITRALPAVVEQPAVEKMTNKLWQLVNEESDPNNTLLEMESLFEQYATRSGVQALMDRLRRNLAVGWELLGYGVEGDGFIDHPLPGWQPESATLRVRQAMLSASDAVRLIAAGQRLTVLLPDLGQRSLSFDVEFTEIPFLPARPIQIAYWMDQQPAKFLTMERGRRTLTFDVPAGKHRLHLRSLDPISNQFLRVYEHANVAADAAPPVTRRYHVGTQAQPVVVAMTGPAWLRVDELIDGFTQSRYVAVPAGWQEVALQASRRPSLQRVFVRTIDSSPKVPPRRVTREVRVIPQLAALTERFNPHILRYDVVDQHRPGMLDHGTWTNQLAYRQREAALDSHSEDPDSDYTERFVEVVATHRKAVAEQDTYYRYQLLGRHHIDAGLVLGGRAAMRRPLPGLRLPWPTVLDSGYWRLRGEVLNQNLDFDTGDHAWAARGNLRVGIPRFLDARTTWTPGIELFARQFGLKHVSREHRAQVDRDVFSAYQRDHDFGLALTHNWVFRPWLDTRLSADFRWVTNPGLNLLDPDYVRGKLDVSQLLGRFMIRADYTERYSFSDEDRQESKINRRIGLAVEWRRWRRRDDRLAVLASATHDFTDNHTDWLLGVRYDVTHGRGFRDFWPGDIVFRPLEERFNSDWRSDSISESTSPPLNQQTENYEQ